MQVNDRDMRCLIVPATRKYTMNSRVAQDIIHAAHEFGLPHLAHYNGSHAL
jgi:hypothetical protein